MNCHEIGILIIFAIIIFLFVFTDIWKWLGELFE